MSRYAIIMGTSWHEGITCRAQPTLLWPFYAAKGTRLHEKISGQLTLITARVSLSRAARLVPCKSGGMIQSSKSGVGAWSSIIIAKLLVAIFVLRTVLKRLFSWERGRLQHASSPIFRDILTTTASIPQPHSRNQE